MRRQQFWLACLTVGIGALSAACSGGEIGEPSVVGPGEFGSTSGIRELGTDTGSHTPAGDQRAPYSPNGAPVTATFEPAPAALRRLTVDQYRNSLNDLMGIPIELTTELEPDTALNGFYAIGAARATISPAAAEKFEEAAYLAAEQALAPARRASFVGCTPKAAIDSECTRPFVDRFGARAYRRPLTAAESARLVRLAETSAQALGDFYGGLQFAIAGILQSPKFLFRVELGEPDPSDAKRLRYDNYELASRLSYTLWNTTPDTPLLDAAKRGELVTAEGLSAASARLLADVRAQAALDNFQGERLGLGELASLSKADSVYSGLSDDLRTALRDDVLRTLAEYTKDGADFLALFETKTAFVNRALAGIYGISVESTALTQVELPDSVQRIGLLGKPAFLALNAHSNETSPTLRGKYIRERILCQSIGAPPPNVVPVLGAPDPNAPTMRDRLKDHATDPTCASCHTQMDPLGLALEHFDAIGRFRAADHGHALDTSGTLDGHDFDGERELSALLRDDPRAAACIARQLYRYATAHVETDGEAVQIDALVGNFVNAGHDLRALLTRVVQSEGFRFASKETSP